MTDLCPCGHVLSMCHRENAKRWCPSDGAGYYKAGADRLEEALRQIADNALSWHGDNAAKGRALIVIAKTARAVLAGGETTEEGKK